MTSKRSDSGLDGILLIDKPAGWTSHDVVAKVRRITGQRRMGHTGTLDPMATGLLVLCLGRATRLVEYLTGHDKRYMGTVRFGRVTTTDDAEGDTLAESPAPELTSELIETVVAQFRGTIGQRPPAFSALKVDGKRAYALARAGAAPELPERSVTIREVTARPTAPDEVAIDVTCSAGTYIRSLARDMGERLGCGAHLASLRRLQAGPLHIDAAATLESLETACGAGEIGDLLLPPDEGIWDFDAAILGDDGAKAVANGGAWHSLSSTVRRAEPARIYGTSGEFIAVGSVSNLGEIRALKVFRRNNSSDL